MGARMRGQALPFEIDPELAEAAENGGVDDDLDEDFAKELYPVCTFPYLTHSQNKD